MEHDRELACERVCSFSIPTAAFIARFCSLFGRGLDSGCLLSSQFEFVRGGLYVDCCLVDSIHDLIASVRGQNILVGLFEPDLSTVEGALVLTTGSKVRESVFTRIVPNKLYSTKIGYSG